MPNTSATGGFLAGSAVRHREELENVFHDLIAGITGLPAKLVRPRYQPKGIKTPPPSANWCAFVVTAASTPGSGRAMRAVQHQAEGDGHDELLSDKPLDLLVSMYGPEAWEIMERLLDGLSIWQNRELLRRNGLGFVRHSPVTHVPEQESFGWLERWDCTLTFNRMTRRRYEVQNIVEAAPIIVTE